MRRRGRFRLPALAALILLATAPAARAQQCMGDCDDNGQVTIDEIIRGVGIALVIADPSRCAVYGDTATIDQIITAVANSPQRLSAARRGDRNRDPDGGGAHRDTVLDRDVDAPAHGHADAHPHPDRHSALDGDAHARAVGHHDDDIRARRDRHRLVRPPAPRPRP